MTDQPLTDAADTPARAALPDPAPPLRVGVIGTGGISRAHAPGWLGTGAELHAFSLEGASAFAEEFGAILHDTLEELLEAVDAVDVCTPTPSHPALVHAALDAGKDVVCEKPLALTEQECQGMIERAREVGRHLFPAHVVRFFPQYAAARRALDSGDLGQLGVLRFERTGAMPTQPWFADESQSGGIVMDQMIHDIDQAVWHAGAVSSVYARQHATEGAGEIRTAHVVLTHVGGAISHCRGLWGPAGTQFRYTFSLAGDRGRLDYDSARNTGVSWDEVASAAQASGDGFLPDISGMPSPYALEIREFTDVLRGRAPAARVAAEDGAYAVRVSRAAMESLATGRRIAC
ncbi:gfo/Idh/MocA family oxidoreductase [Brachybacterium endophyticum]|uniref:Gfo/Idh/MocA family oxidoreductase n=1 Tax=Brachybacterium endophyticum TaxID=2182385 RepID=A0A2U2RMJ5_9MICO|nr:Gfo/Idh/MocA family oxidoreductase [Brachybacterium endophyticum]PWH07099.1 gfo/Idh/MocA family oxidoreductase [Brachybacterium endophyticum]